MELDIRIRLSDKLYLKNPEDSVIGRRIVHDGLLLINQLGFEDFTFKKLAREINTTEATIYRYFENKHRLLVYLITWYWSYLEYKIVFGINNLRSAETRLRTIIELLAREPEATKTDNVFIPEREAYQLLLWEGSKAYLTRHINKDNKDRLFKPYKDLCNRISEVMLEYNPHYAYPNSLASTLLEMSHSQKFFMQNLPALADAGKDADNQLIKFLENLVFGSLKNGKS